ncbi:hypothetical protein [Antarcticimicrobium sediminis]|uniref:EthD domain-containing protein n=1 Tax=Antarcticimicrobium sediminis TaxID=2546227 RepID=A0A4R5EPX7_9RHOB|nr:hypothetical protein [Antarcticimicrobium sediminis]TDE36714.1 hypothetical protein E1B25_14465 [Antarcticimicrobium sediminis]
MESVMWGLELSVSDQSAELPGWLARHGAALAALPAVILCESFAPIEDLGAAVRFHDADVPAAMIVLGFAERADLLAALGSPVLMAALAARPGGVQASAACFRRHRTPLPGDNMSRDSAVSYVVRYRLPCDDAPGFVAEYLAGHLPIQADFPGIRRVLGFEPIEGGPQGATPAGYLVGNEVSFDDVAAFCAAMESPVLDRLRAHSGVLPPRDGLCTHHLMKRRLLK